jgi:hypothetical protein
MNRKKRERIHGDFSHESVRNRIKHDPTHIGSTDLHLLQALSRIH